MINFIRFALLFLALIKYGQCRELLDPALPEITNTVLEKGTPIKLEQNYTKLQIKGLDGTLYSDSLSQLYNVTELRIIDNQISKIETGAFCSLYSLRVLEINFESNTKAPILTKHHFENCKKLEELLLVFNFDSPSKLNNDAFPNLFSLRKLIIQNLNVGHMKKEFLANLKSLNRLVLSHCHIKEIQSEVFKALNNLEEIEISHSDELTHLPKNLFKSTPKLIRLSLIYCGIKDITCDEFEGLSSLKQLNLMQNRISSLDAEKIATNMPNLFKLNIAQNLLPCKQSGALANELHEKLNHPVDVSYKFDSCQQEN